MAKKIIAHSKRLALSAGIVLCLLVFVQAVLGSNVDPTDKYAWGASVGWVNFAPTHGGVTVYSDHLEGYAWGENVGWIRMGTHTGGGSHTYANDAAGTYGVNNDGVGNLSGYAWGTNVGWINFDPTGSYSVTIDPVSGDFDGYAWGENVGWIHFQNDSPAYKVNTDWRGDLISPTYQSDVAAIITARRPGPASSAGLDVADVSFLNQAGDGIIFGHNDAEFRGGVTDDLPGGVDKRWARIWQLDVVDEGDGGGNVTLTFDISEAGGNGNFSGTGTYYLLKRDTGSSGDFATVTVVDTSVSGDRLTFTVDAANLGSEFTLGATADSPTAVQVQGLDVRGSEFALLGALGLLVLGCTALVLWRRRPGAR